MKIKDYSIRTYKIFPPIGGTSGWGGKAIVYTNGGERTTREIWGRTRDEVYSRVERKIQEIVEKRG